MSADDTLPIAVYGTLRPGGRAWHAFGLETRTRHLGPCRIAGRILDLGGYPGVVEGDGLVAGDLLLPLDDAIVAELDAYEGDGYARVIVTLPEPAGMTAQLWRWEGSVDGARAVPGDDWLNCRATEIDPTVEGGAP